MNIVFTCGGTGGHIYPAIAVARLFQQRQPGCSILFIGAEDGMENKIVPREGFRLETLKISNFQRKLTPSAIAHNIETAAHLTQSRRKVHRILPQGPPDSHRLLPGHCHRHRWLRELSGAARGRETFDSDHGPRIKRCAGADDPDGGKIYGPDHGLV